MANPSPKNTEIEFGLRAIIRISAFKTAFYKKYSLLAIITAILVLILAMVFRIDPYKLLIELKTLVIAYVPSILGFTIAGYTLVIGFIQTDMLKSISNPLKGSPYSLYQRMSSMFALNLIIQGIALIVAYGIHLIVYFDTSAKVYKCMSNEYCETINWIGVFIAAITLTYPLFLVLQMIVNIFGFSQLHHYFIKKDIPEQSDPPPNP